MIAFKKKFSGKKAAIVFLMILSLCMQLFLQISGISADNTNAKDFTPFITKVSITDGNGNPFDTSKPIEKNSSVKIEYNFEIPEETAKSINSGDVYTLDMPKEIKVENRITTELVIDSESKQSSGQVTLTANAGAKASKNVDISEVLNMSQSKSVLENEKVSSKEKSIVSEENISKIQSESNSQTQNSTEINKNQEIQVRQKDTVLGKNQNDDDVSNKDQEVKGTNNKKENVSTVESNKTTSDENKSKKVQASASNKTAASSSKKIDKQVDNIDENLQNDNTVQNSDKNINSSSTSDKNINTVSNISDKDSINNTDKSSQIENNEKQNETIINETEKYDSSQSESLSKAVKIDSVQVPAVSSSEAGNSEENSLGTVIFNTDNTIEIVFTDYAKTHYENVHGSFSLMSYFDSDKIPGSGDKKLEFIVGGKSETVIINFKGESPTISKQGSYDNDSKEITWTLIVDTKGNSSKGLSISDIIKGEQIFKEDAFTDSNGNTGNCMVDNEIEHGNYDSQSKTFTYNIPDGFTGIKYIKFKTTPSEKVISEQGTTKIENKADLLNESNEKIDDAYANVNIKVSRIAKRGELLSNKSIKWTININNNKDTLKKPTIIDEISKDLELDKDSVTLQKQGETAKELVINDDYILDENNKFQYEFKEEEISDSYVLTFITKIKNYSSSGDSSNISNTASLITDNKIYTGNSNNVKIPSGISKKGSYNVDTGLIQWAITVNPNQVSMEKPVITDNITGNQEFVENSVTVYDTSNLSAEYTDYTDKYVKSDGEESNDSKGILTIAFNNNIDKTYIIKFNTKPDAAAYEQSIGSKAEFTNSCSLKIGNNAAISCNSNKVEVDLRSFDKRSDEGYDEETNEIVWNIVINKYNVPIEGIVSVEDKISEDQEFVKGDDGSLLGEVILLKNGEEVSDIASELDCKEDGKNIIFTLKNTSKESKTTDEYEIKLKTKITDFSKFADNNNEPYRNIAYLYSDNLNLWDYEDVSVPKKSFVTKSAENYKQGDSFIDWNVKINLAGIQKDTIIDNAVISDTLEEGLALASMDNPIEFIEYDSAGSETNSWNLYDLVSGNENPYNNKERKLSLKLPKIDTSKVYLLKFRTDIVDRNKTSVSNSVSFSGTGYKSDASSNPVKIKYQSASGTGSGEIKFGSIKITKMDKDDHSIKLSGAEFKLYKSDDLENSIAVQKSDSNGEVYFNNIKKGSYVIKETGHPENYVIDKESEAVNIDGDNISLEWFNSKKASKSIKIIKIRKNKPNILLKGAEFGVYNSDNKLVESKKTESDGTAIFENLENGIYTIREISAPSGYSRNYDKKKVTIDDNSEDVQEFTFENDKSSSGHHHNDDDDDDDSKITGSIKIIKTDDNNNALKGAEFSLYDLKGVLIQSEFSNDTGIAEFKNLPIGSYTVKETKGISGYKMDVMPHTVTLSSSKQKSLIIKNEKDDKEPSTPIIIPSEGTGCIKVTKLNTNNEVLSGAQIGLYNVQGQAIASKTTGSEGVVIFDNIPVGKYTIKEVKAPKGYTLSNEKIEISLGNSQVKNYSIINKKDAEVSPAGTTKNSSKISSAVKNAVITTPSKAVKTVKNKIISRLPQSGSLLDTKVLIAIGILMICAGLAFYIKKKCKGWK